jgi:hypothetical protein
MIENIFQKSLIWGALFAVTTDSQTRPQKYTISEVELELVNALSKQSRCAQSTTEQEDMVKLDSTSYQERLKTDTVLRMNFWARSISSSVLAPTKQLRVDVNV